MFGRVGQALTASSSLLLSSAAASSTATAAVATGSLSVIAASFSSSTFSHQQAGGHKAPRTSLKGVKEAAAAAGRASLVPKPVFGTIDESGADTEDVEIADAMYSVDGEGTGVKTGIAALLQAKAGASKGIDPVGLAEAAEGVPVKSVSSLTANPYRYAALKPKAAPMWMLFEAQREERPLPDLGKGAAARLRDNPTIIESPLVMRDSKGRAYATGRRKEAVARVWVGKGDGKFTVNGQDLADALPRIADRQQAIEPLVVTQTCGALDVMLTVKGGGLTGQAGAIRHGLANALANYDPYLKPALRRFKLIQRDPRMVERKKPGQKKARKQFQWVKR